MRSGLRCTLRRCRTEALTSWSLARAAEVSNLGVPLRRLVWTAKVVAEQPRLIALVDLGTLELNARSNHRIVGSRRCARVDHARAQLNVAGMSGGYPTLVDVNVACLSEARVHSGVA